MHVIFTVENMHCQGHKLPNSYNSELEIDSLKRYEILRLQCVGQHWLILHLKKMSAAFLFVTSYLSDSFIGLKTLLIIFYPNKSFLTVFIET